VEPAVPLLWATPLLAQTVVIEGTPLARPSMRMVKVPGRWMLPTVVMGAAAGLLPDEKLGPEVLLPVALATGVAAGSLPGAACAVPITVLGLGVDQRTD
jgi:hypothetical protein